MQYHVITLEDIKCVHELAMEGLGGPSMSAPIYYVVLACSSCSHCSDPDPDLPEQCSGLRHQDATEP